MNPLIVFFSFLLAWVVFASLFEWTLHKFVMHRPVGSFVYPFRAHALVHHRIFKADHTYHLIKEEDKVTIPMAWWNGPVLCLLSALPALPFAFLLGTSAPFWGAFITTAAYYGVYEYLHWCMHLPKARRVERSWLFRRMNGHHLLHHRYMQKNFNVVLPIADLLFGTFIPRAKTRFAQPQNPAVPSVQPLEAAILETATT